MREQIYEIFHTFNLLDQERGDPDNIIKRFDEYLLPQTNASVERHQLLQDCKLNTKIFNNFLDKLAANCEFVQIQDSLIKNRSICKIK